MFGEIPASPVVVPLAVIAFVVAMATLHHRGMLTWPRVFVVFVLCAYLAGIVANTVFPIYRDMPQGDRDWTAGLSLVPLEDYEVADAVMNAFVFVPLGFLVPVVLGRSSLGAVLAVGAAVSLVIELTQYVTGIFLHGGHIADVNDLLFNVVGTGVGFGVFQMVSRVSSAHLPDNCSPFAVTSVMVGA